MYTWNVPPMGSPFRISKYALDVYSNQKCAIQIYVLLTYLLTYLPVLVTVTVMEQSATIEQQISRVASFKRHL